MWFSITWMALWKKNVFSWIRSSVPLELVKIGMSAHMSPEATYPVKYLTTNCTTATQKLVISRLYQQILFFFGFSLHLQCY